MMITKFVALGLLLLVNQSESGNLQYSQGQEALSLGGHGYGGSFGGGGGDGGGSAAYLNAGLDLQGGHSFGLGGISAGYGGGKDQWSGGYAAAAGGGDHGASSGGGGGSSDLGDHHHGVSIVSGGGGGQGQTFDLTKHDGGQGHTGTFGGSFIVSGKHGGGGGDGGAHGWHQAAADHGHYSDVLRASEGHEGGGLSSASTGGHESLQLDDGGASLHQHYY